MNKNMNESEAEMKYQTFISTIHSEFLISPLHNRLTLSIHKPGCKLLIFYYIPYNNLN
jgi:hypothetical protein